jgi:hypothetical protein
MPPAHLLHLQDPPDLTAVHLDPFSLGGLGQGVQGPLRGCLLVVGGQVSARRALRPARRNRAGQRDDATPLVLAQPARPSRYRPVTQPVQTLAVEPVQPFPHGLRVTAQLRRDRRGVQPGPTQRNDLRPLDPVRRRMPGPGQLTDLPLLNRING